MPVAEAVERLSGDEIVRFLMRQRWFAAKGGTPAAVRVAGWVTTPWGDGTFALARVAVRVGDAEQTYQLPLAARTGVPRDVPPAAIVHSPDSAGIAVYDAVYDADFRRGLVRAFVTGAVLNGPGPARWVAEPVGTPPFVFDDAMPTTVGSAEQSNTAIVVGSAGIIKLFRRLQHGVHPDVEVTKFLTTRASFANTPRLLGVARFEDGDGSMTAGMFQEYLAGSTDGWAYALERGRSYFEAPRQREIPNAFIADAKRLGAVTRAMHDALASDDDDVAFAPEPVTPEDLELWTRRTQQSVRDSLALLERQLGAATVPKERAAEAQALVRRADHYVGWIDELADELGDDLGLRTRTHGDYHLGQILRTRAAAQGTTRDGDFMIIDFEGEPSRALGERREKTSPLRDVAGMCRSFAYAAATLSMSVGDMMDIATREIRAARWERDVRAAFVTGYLGQSDENDAPGILPEDERHAKQLIALFETEKAFYELAYELNSRPAWAWIPMRGIAKLFTKS